MNNERMLERLQDRWLEPPEPQIVFLCDCCGEEVYVGDEYIEFGDGECMLKEHALELGEAHFEKYDDYIIKAAGQDD